MSNIRAVAKKAGVSIATVSRAFSKPESVSKENLKKVRDAVDAIGYRPDLMARNFRSTKSFAVVVLVPDLSNLFFTKVIRAIQKTAIKHGYSILLGETRDSMELELEYVKLVETRQADGVIQLSPHSEERNVLPKPYITAVAACGASNTPYYSVRMDHIAASRAVMEYLLSLGHRKIACITGLEGNPHSVDRMEGYTSALKSVGIDIDKDFIFEGDFTVESGYSAGEYFSGLENRPTAVFAMNDNMAIGAIKAFKESKLQVPKDISIVGFDDLTLATYLDPALTTIRQPAEEMGKKAMELLLQLLDGREIKQHEYVLKHEFVIRESVSPVKCAYMTSLKQI